MSDFAWFWLSLAIMVCAAMGAIAFGIAHTPPRTALEECATWSRPSDYCLDLVKKWDGKAERSGATTAERTTP